MSEALLALNDVSYAYADGTVALRGVSLQICSGEWLGICGGGGAGKSTLARICAGLLVPSGGTVAGSALGSAALVTQNPANTFICSSVSHEVAFAPARRGLSGKKLQDVVAAALSAVGLPSTLLHKDPMRLSGGEQQRVAIAAALAAGAPLVILDEPASMLDHVARAQLMDAVNNICRQRNIGVIHISHDLDELAAVDKLAVMAKGEILACGTVQQVLSQPHLHAAVGSPLPDLMVLAYEMAVRNIDIGDPAPTLSAWLTALAAERRTGHAG